MNKKNEKQLNTIRTKLDTIATLDKNIEVECNRISKNKKNVKDPNAPKRPSTAWIYFYSDQVKSTKEKYPEKSTKEICSLLGKKWSKMTPKQKSKYELKAKQSREDYNRKKEEYNNSKKLNLESKNEPKKETKKESKKESKKEAEEEFDVDELELSEDF